MENGRIRTVLIDDERHSVETLSFKLQRFCPEVHIVDTFTNPTEGLEYLRNHRIDLLFLDIEMPNMGGFELLEKLGDVPFDVIFVTAYDEFGIQAIKFSALDYLLKPVQGQELQTAVARFRERSTHSISAAQLEVLFSNMREEHPGQDTRVALATKERIEFVSPQEIVACSSDSNYTRVFLTGGRKRLISRTLKDFEDMLSNLGFFRVHHSHMVNLAHVREYVRSDGGYVVLSNEMKLPVARTRREDLLARFER